MARKNICFTCNPKLLILNFRSKWIACRIAVTCFAERILCPLYKCKKLLSCNRCVYGASVRTVWIWKFKSSLCNFFAVSSSKTVPSITALLHAVDAAAAFIMSAGFTRRSSTSFSNQLLCLSILSVLLKIPIFHFRSLCMKIRLLQVCLLLRG